MMFSRAAGAPLDPIKVKGFSSAIFTFPSSQGCIDAMMTGPFRSFFLRAIVTTRRTFWHIA
jgi:hypothetical protein